MRALATVLLALCCLLLLGPAVAGALPGDEPIALVAPADGATVAPSPDGTRFVYTCPLYRTLDLGGGFASYGALTDYGAALATSPELGTDGRLRADRRVDLDEAHRDNTLPAGQCSSTLGNESRAGLEPGTYWWQASRICTQCAGSYETSELRRLVVRADVRASLTPPPALYGGYPAAWTVGASGAPDGSAVTLQRQVRGSWKRVASTTAGSGRAELIATLPAGRQRVRVAVAVGSESFASRELGVTARGDRGPRATSSRSDGDWSGARRAPVTFRVAGDGRLLRDFRANVTMLCAAVPIPGTNLGQTTTRAGVAAFASARIAPDGRFFGVAVREGSSVLVRGRVQGRALADGSAQLSVGPCTGQLRFAARRG